MNSKENINDILTEAIVGTIDNHYYDFNIGSGILTMIEMTLLGNASNLELLGFIEYYFSEKSFRYNVPLRKKIVNYYYKNINENILLDLLNVLYKKSNNKKLKDLIDSLNVFTNPDNYISNNNHHNLITAFKILHLFINERKANNEFFRLLLYDFYKMNDIRETFKNEFSNDDSIVIEEITETCYKFLSNADGYKLKDSFNGVLLNGNIEVSSDRGYRSHPKMPQQDAVGSMVYDDTHFINIVADGVGGAQLGHVASLELVNRLLNWYKSLPIEVIDDVNAIYSLLSNELNRINHEILHKYQKQAQSTVVIAITIGDKTIITNVGDSTAYGYDMQTDSLIELTTLDSMSYGLGYEEARNNPTNNVITQAIGCFENIDIHTCLVNNAGQRIILSSDGITDLISEQRFKSYFKNNTSSKDMVDDAVYDSDATMYKIEDNVSAIAVNLPNGITKRRGM